MSDRDEVRKQFSSILAIVRAEGYSIEEVMPEEMQDYFQQMTALKSAHTYIKEMESRESNLLAENRSLRQKLKAKEETADQSEEFKALKVDLQQAQHQIDFQKELTNEATERAARYQRKLLDAVKSQVVASHAVAKIERLEVELYNQRAAYQNLVKENANAAELAENQHLQDQNLIAEKDRKLMALATHTEAVEAESDQFSEAFTTLIDTLESEHSKTAAVLNDKAILLQQTERKYSAIVSELTPLNRFYERAFIILGIYQSIFQTLSNPSSRAIMSMPQTLDELLDSAANDLYLYQGVHQELRSDSLAEEQVCVQLDGIADNATLMFNSLSAIKDDVAGFLARLRNQPRAWAAMKNVFIVEPHSVARYGLDHPG
ncbi:hypothetical protein BKA66DRAFT_510946 [Pyrenochaeta sp. MPI-SDFR-AT-0127]|nr:hypothetical protein BKA66DRAFT_510946 [Pyrenochaeta sp. MPI-SDFR-AT-0127]